MSDRIILTGLAFYAHHGVSDAEQERGQVFTVDVEVEANLHRAGHTDALEDTLDYRILYARVREAVTSARYRLIEAVAEAVAHALLEADRVDAVTVRVRKPHVRLGGPMESAAVEVTRRRRPSAGPA